MTYPDYIRRRAVEMRVERQLSIDEIAERLALPRTTIYHWVRDIPLGRERAWKPAQIRAAAATSAKHQALRDAAYARGVAEWSELERVPTFREFVALYIAEGSKRNRNRVAIANSDDRVLAVAVAWLRRLSVRRLDFAIQYHADQDLDELRRFWAEALECAEAEIRFQRKSNSNQLAGRTWRSERGVLTVGVNDTYLRARLQAWIDLIRESWTLDSAEPHGV